MISIQWFLYVSVDFVARSMPEGLILGQRQQVSLGFFNALLPVEYQTVVLKIESTFNSFLPFLSMPWHWVRMVLILDFWLAVALILLERGPGPAIPFIFQSTVLSMPSVVFWRLQGSPQRIKPGLLLRTPDIWIMIVDTLIIESTVSRIQILTNLLVGEASLQVVFELPLSDILILNLSFVRVLGHVCNFHQGVLPPLAQFLSWKLLSLFGCFESSVGRLLMLMLLLQENEPFLFRSTLRVDAAPDLEFGDSGTVFALGWVQILCWEPHLQVLWRMACERGCIATDRSHSDSYSQASFAE